MGKWFGINGELQMFQFTFDVRIEMIVCFKHCFSGIDQERQPDIGLCPLHGVLMSLCCGFSPAGN